MGSCANRALGALCAAARSAARAPGDARACQGHTGGTRPPGVHTHVVVTSTLLVVEAAGSHRAHTTTRRGLVTFCVRTLRLL